MLLCDSLQVVHEQILVLWQQGEHHSQPIENQQEAFGQRSLICATHTNTSWLVYDEKKHTCAFLRVKRCMSGR